MTKSKLMSYKSRPQSKQKDMKSYLSKNRRVSPKKQRVSPNKQQTTNNGTYQSFTFFYFYIKNHCNSNSPYDSQSDSLEESFASSSVNDRSQESSGLEEQDVKMSVAVSEDKPMPVSEDSFAYNSQSDSYTLMEDSFASSSINDGSQESSGSEEQDVKMSVAVSEDKPASAKWTLKSSKRQAKLDRNLEAVVPPEPSVSNHL